MQPEKSPEGRRWNSFLNFMSLIIIAALPLLLFDCSKSVLSFSSLGMEIKTSTLEVLAVNFLQFSLWRPSYLLTE